MPNDDLQLGTNPSGGIPVSGVNSAHPIYVAPTGLGHSSESTIAKSTEKEEIKSADPSNPAIPYPHQLIQFFNEDYTYNEGLSASRKLDLAMSNIISSMLDAWNDSIKELDAKRKEELLHPTPDEIRKSEERRAVSQLIDVVLSIAPTAQPQTVENHKNSIFGALVVGTLFVAAGGGAKDAMMIDTLSTSLVGVNPSSNQAPPLQIYTPDIRAELGLLGAAMMQAAMVQANSLTLFKAEGGKQESEITAKNYAEEILALVASNQLTGLVQAIITQNSDRSKPIDPSLASTLTVQLKLILLSSALAALYKAHKEGGTGWIKKEDFLNLLAGNTFGPNQETMDKIVKEMNALFATMPDKGLATKALLAAFYDTNPHLSVLTNPSKLFEKLKPYYISPTETSS